jgi:hypothetical protein
MDLDEFRLLKKQARQNILDDFRCFRWIKKTVKTRQETSGEVRVRTQYQEMSSLMT